jgi:DNA-binding transcriptional ArsR family regulator
MSKAKVTYRHLSVNDKDKIFSRLGEEDRKKALRQLRERECFKYTDRPIWYSRLTETQKAEVIAWYEKWLKVTDTNEIPERPNFVR